MRSGVGEALDFSSPVSERPLKESTTFFTKFFAWSFLPVMAMSYFSSPWYLF